MNRKIFHAGALAYYDSIPGPLKVKVMNVNIPGDGNCLEGSLDLKATQTLGAYRKGELLLNRRSAYVVPREMSFYRAGWRRVNTNFRWE